MNRARTKNTNLRRIQAVLLLMLTLLALRDRQALGQSLKPAVFSLSSPKENISRSVVVR